MYVQIIPLFICLLHKLAVLKMEVLSDYTNYDTIVSNLVAVVLNVTFSTQSACCIIDVL